MNTYQMVGSTNSEIADRLTGTGANAPGYLVDLGSTDASEVARLAQDGKPVIMLNPTGETMAAAVGIGVDCIAAVLHPGQNGAPDQILYVPLPIGEITALDLVHAENDGDGDGDGDRGVEPSGKAATGDDPFAPMHAFDIAQVLDQAARTPLDLSDGPKVDPIPDGAAGMQTVLAPAKPTTYHPKSYTWYHRDKAQVITDQTATLSLPVFVEVYASPNPANKFLRVTSFGTGFSPGKMKWDNSGERGMFQDRMRTRMELGNLPSGSALLMSAPKTRNNEATYTSSGSITIGIKGGEEPEPSASATISASVSSTLLDFKVLEKSAGLVGEWAFDMQLCGTKSDGVYDPDNPLSLVGWAGYVWEVPGLASSTLFPACMSAWSLPLTCQKSLPLTIGLHHRLMYVASSYASKMSGGCAANIPTIYHIDFGAVNV